MILKDRSSKAVSPATCLLSLGLAVPGATRAHVSCFLSLLVELLVLSVLLVTTSHSLLFSCLVFPLSPWSLSPVEDRVVELWARRKSTDILMVIPGAPP